MLAHARVSIGCGGTVPLTVIVGEIAAPISASADDDQGVQQQMEMGEE